MEYLPLGLLQIAAVLIGKGEKVELVDGIMPEGEGKEGGDNFFGITLEDVKKRIERVDFDIAGISAQFTFQWENAAQTAKICKDINPSAKVIVGGAHASVAFQDILKEHDYIDIAVRGEGEYVSPVLIDRIRQKAPLDGIKGIAYRKNGEIKLSQNEFIQDLDSLPFPAYQLVDMEKYFWLVKKYFTRTGYAFKGWERGVTLITSRGCPFSCVFCSIHLHMGKKWRAHSPEYVLRHIDYLVKNYKVKYIHFEDDNFTLDPRRCEAILQGIVDNGWDVRWDTPNGVRADTFDESLLKKCRQSGCTHLIFGIESGCQEVLDKVIGKNLRLPKAEEALRLAKRIGVDVKAFYMMGLPGETKKDIQQTVRYFLRGVWKYECFGGIGMAVPLLGTPLYDICKKYDYFYLEPTIDNLSAGFRKQGIIQTDEFGPDFLKETMKYCAGRVRLLKFFVFFKKVLRNPVLILYLARQIIKLPAREWSVPYNKVVHFHHALLYDLRRNP
jgi:radical SAM superfamily enzyme YgiQ (UPF0313 family)